MNNAIWTKYADSYKELLRALARACEYVASHPSPEEFSRILIEAHQLGWLREDGLADMGMVQRSTANRWLNGAARPSKLQQCVIMNRLAELLLGIAKELRLNDTRN